MLPKLRHQFAGQCPPSADYHGIANEPEICSHRAGLLQGACSVAVVALTDISQDVNSPASARVSAARTVLELALKGVELEDLIVRVEELELQAARS